MTSDSLPTEMPRHLSKPVKPESTRVPQHDLGRWLRLARKELRETLRDRRTIVTLLLMPILVYPLLSIGFRHFLLGSFDKPGEWTYVIAVESEAAQQALQQVVAFGDEVLRQGSQEETASQSSEESVPTLEAVEPRASALHYPVVGDVEAYLRMGNCDLAVRVHELTANEGQQARVVQQRYELLYRQDSPPGRILSRFVERRLAATNQFDLQRRLMSVHRPARVAYDWSLRPVADASNQSLLTLIPLILILMTITGAVYPAIDLTAGERERGTLESLMAAPVPRLGMLFAKYVAVVTVALLTAGLNLAAMFVTTYSMGLSKFVFGETGLTISTVVLIVLLLVLFAAFFSAVLLAITSFARSFKEAQAYLIPLMLLAISPGLFTLMPGIEMNAIMAVTPLLNMVLLARDVLQGTSDPLLAGMAVFSTILYAVLAIALAARVFGSDAMLFGSQLGWGDLFRRPDQLHSVPSVTGVALCTALIFALQSIAGGLLATFGGERPSLEFAYVGSALVTILLYFLLPLGIATLQFVRIRTAFQVRGAGLAAIAGAILLGLSLWPLAHELVLLSGLANPELLVKVRERAAEIRSISPVLLVLCVAIVPAVCEEWFFRGYVLGSLRQRTSPWSAILLTAILFGLFHVFVTVVLAVRFLPSLTLGLVLGYVCWRTRSVLPGMLLHMVHNGLLILMGRYQPELQQLGFGASEVQHVPLSWLVGSALGIAAGLALVWVSGRPAMPADEPTGLPAAASPP